MNDRIDLASESFRDKVLGCWMGKNVGGTLGGPLEKAWGEEQPLDVWWYPKLQEGGIPNDDLELQLVWLKALEEVGPQLTAQDLGQYWLNHVGYDPDEYGLSKANLRRGLLPPVSGAYNNWFKDCMGCPIRSEIWACVAPGHPRVAVRYAYEDAICDHAGGESVYGEFFNVAIESAAFVETDRNALIDIGLSYVPAGTQTRKAIQAALDAHRAGVTDWREARRRVMAATPHAVAQYSPLNIAFQVIGWLYGDDFADAVCKAVNCGYDTDCTGATLGSYLGILLGRSALPAKWTAPLGDAIAPGGLTHAYGDVVNPVPMDLHDLTARTIAQARRVLAYHGLLNADGTVRAAGRDELFADDASLALAKRNPMRVDFAHAGATVRIGVDYVDTPAAVSGTVKRLVAHVANPQPVAVAATVGLDVPAGWAAPPARAVTVPARGELAVPFDLKVPAPKLVANANRLSVRVDVAHRPAVAGAPVVLIGANRYRVAGPFPASGASDRAMFDAALPPESPAGDLLTAAGRPGDWRDLYAPDNVIPIGALLAAPGTLYAQTFLHADVARKVFLNIPATVPVKLWVNGAKVAEAFTHLPLRPNYGATSPNGEPTPNATVELRPGWNELLIKFVRGAGVATPEAHFILATGNWGEGIVDVGRTRFPWD